MSLLVCEKCQGQVADDADTCPHCGTKNFRKPSKAPLIIGGLISAAIVYHFATVEPAPPPAPRPPADPASSARGACMLFVKQRLHDPGSAEFPETPSTSITKRDGNMWLVRMPVRARNSLNALRLTNFDCLMSFRSSDETWSALTISESR